MGCVGEFWQNVVHWRRESQTSLAFLPWESHEWYEKAKCITPKYELPRSVDSQYATGKEWRKCSRRNEEAEPKQKWRPVVDVSGGESKVRCCKDQYCKGPWNVRSMNQDKFSSVQFSSVSQACLTLCHPMDCSMPGFPAHHQLPEPAQTHVLQVHDVILPSHPVSSPSLPAFNLSQHQRLFQWDSSSHQVAKVLEFQLQYQYFQWIVMTDFLRIDSCDLFAVQGTLKSLLQHYSSKALEVVK